MQIGFWKVAIKIIIMINLYVHILYTNIYFSFVINENLFLRLNHLILSTKAALESISNPGNAHAGFKSIKKYFTGSLTALKAVRFDNSHFIRDRRPLPI
jgi:hypothetical protein